MSKQQGKQQSFASRSFRQYAFLSLFALSAMAGCYQQAVAPAVEYNEEDAELLREELGKMDWE